MTQAAKTTEVHGLLLVDKAPGLTSHDVVGMLRRVLGTRAIGHAGTLDPMATGLLVVLVGEATKLSSYLTATDKTYEATLVLGVETDSLDADGSVVRECAVPPLSASEVSAACARFVGEIDQQVPAVSAVKVAGQTLHKLARKGREVEAPVRRVKTHELELLAVRPTEIDFRVRCSKGYYVRALGRDLSAALGTVGHLSALRRLRSGSFDVRDALPFELVVAARRDESQRPAVRRALMPLAQACALLPCVSVSEAGAAHLRHGRSVGPEEQRTRSSEQLEGGVCVAMSELGRPLALVREVGGVLSVVRGFRDVD